MAHCIKPGCSRKVVAYGLCEAHDRRERRALEDGQEPLTGPIRAYGQNTRQISCRVSEETYEALEREAKPLGLKVYGLVQKLVLEYVRGRR